MALDFSRASFSVFSQLSTQLATMSRSTLLQSGQAVMSEKKRILATLKDLETTFTDLNTRQNWSGIGHNGAAFQEQAANSSLNTLAARRTSLNAFAAGMIPHSEWVKDKKCHWCGEIGHILADCPHRQHRDRPRNNHGGRPRNDRLPGNDRATRPP